VVAAATGVALEDQAAQVLETAAGVEDETATGVLEDQTPQALLLLAEAETDLLVVVAELLHTPQLADELEELVTLAGVVVVVVQTVHEAGVVLVTFTGVVVVVVLATVVVVDELVHTSQSPEDVATAAAEAAPTKAAVVMKDFILIVWFVWFVWVRLSE
jgi:hypothetical protein